MKFKTVTHYVEKSFEDKPSFIIVLEDLKTGKEISYISNGCQFVEQTEGNINELISEYDCEEYLKELLDSKITDLSVITDGYYMFFGCTNLQQFTVELPNLTDGCGMFEGCTNLQQFTVELPNLTDGCGMFEGCTNLQQFTVELPNLTDGSFMFVGCNNLQKD
jgi:hypothetical protein